MSIGQVEMWNSERRRRALVSSCACMRLESAMRTAIADEAAAGRTHEAELRMKRN